MPSNPMQRKVRNSFLLGIAVALLIAIIAAVVVFFVVIKPKIDEKEEEEKQVYAYAYRLKAGVYAESGQPITADMVETVEIPVETEFTDFVPAKMMGINMPFDEGYKSRLALTEGTILTYSMLYTEEETPDSLRYTEYNMITLPQSLDVGDYIDIRFRFSNGQDLIVVSKKEIVAAGTTTIGLNLTEEEIVILNSAIVETYVMMGAAELYATIYVEPGMQEAATKTYMPTNEVITLINANPNIVYEAKAGLVSLYSNQGVVNIRNQINAAGSSYAEQSKENVTAGIQAQIEAAKQARAEYLGGIEGEEY